MISKIIKVFFKVLPYGLIVKIYPSIHKTIFADIIDIVYEEKFYKRSPLFLNFNNYINKAKSFNKICLIQRGNWDYRVINFCFIREMISNIIWCLENGYKPLIDIDAKNGDYSEQSNLWEKMFLQPFSEDLKKVKNSMNYIVCPVKTHVIIPRMTDALDQSKSEFWGLLYDKFLVFNEECKKYFQNEYDVILKGKKVLACLGRGTDYTDLKPKGHPVQPSVEELVQKAKKVFEEEKLDYVYLATEEKKIADRFKTEFNNKVLENKRQYYDVKYDADDGINRVSAVSFNRKNDDFLKSLEYMSSINLLSKCDSIVAGLCGGSEAAVYFNKGKYKVCYLFDKGLY